MSERLVYHTGFLAAERYANKELDKRANELLVRAERGEIILLQRRLSVGVYEYIAIESISPRAETGTSKRAAPESGTTGVV